MSISCVYLLYNVDGFIYIGKTKNLTHRLNGHRSNYKANGDCASKKLGPDWDCEILEECDEKDLSSGERFYYEFYLDICPEMIVNRYHPGRSQEEWIDENRAYINDRVRKYFDLHHKEENYRQKHNDSQRKYAETNRDKIRDYQRIYRRQHYAKYLAKKNKNKNL